VATVRAEIDIDADADEVWKAIGDFAAGPELMAPGFVTGCQVEGDIRVVTFASGTVARERLIGIEQEQRRISFSIIGDTVQPEHDNASMQVIALEPGCSRFVWIHDVLPDELGEAFHANMLQAIGIIRNALGVD
jgi:hypothetical protein